MGALKELFDRLPKPHASSKQGTDPKYKIICAYSAGNPCPLIENGSISTRACSEMIELRRESDEKGHNQNGLHQNSLQMLIIASFEDEPTRIVYLGNDEAEMRSTLENMRVPYSQNLGDLVFYSLRELIGKKNAPVYIEDRITSGREPKLELALKRLLHVWDGKKIDGDFYSGIKPKKI